MNNPVINHLYRLPNELLSHVSSYLDKQSLSSLSLSSRQLNGLVKAKRTFGVLDLDKNKNSIEKMIDQLKMLGAGAALGFNLISLGGYSGFENREVTQILNALNTHAYSSLKEFLVSNSELNKFTAMQKRAYSNIDETKCQVKFLQDPVEYYQDNIQTCVCTINHSLRQLILDNEINVLNAELNTAVDKLREIRLECLGLNLFKYIPTIIYHSLVECVAIAAIKLNKIEIENLFLECGLNTNKYYDIKNSFLSLGASYNEIEHMPRAYDVIWPVPPLQNSVQLIIEDENLDSYKLEFSSTNLITIPSVEQSLVHIEHTSDSTQ